MEIALTYAVCVRKLKYQDLRVNARYRDLSAHFSGFRLATSTHVLSVLHNDYHYFKSHPTSIMLLILLILSVGT